MNERERKINTGIKFKRPILALGAQLKGSLCIAKNRSIFLTDSFGDLEDPDNFDRFNRSVRRLLKFRPRVIAYDLHPEYLSSKLARDIGSARRDIKLAAVQHHHAHIASCMFDNNIKGKVIGVCFDGTGFGPDGNLWGAEVLVADFRGFSRLAHLEYVPLIGGAKAIQEPFRVCFAWLYKIYRDRLFRENIDFVKRLDKDSCRVFKQMLKGSFNCPLSSSLGRLFDAVSCLLGLGDFAHFEAEAAIELERLASSAIGHTVPAGRQGSQVTGYEYKISLHNGTYVIDPAPMFKGIIKDLKKGVSKAEIALEFHYSIAKMIRNVSKLIRKKTKINQAVLSGGVFQNKILRDKTIETLSNEGFGVFSHSRFSTTDSGICLGQALIANKLVS